ncbi:malectin domain-containing carbohydrate-binding protein [Paraglaciecola sp.]|uniref:malectin domain-containing carbohydrate-binding protein n=1 Tax=Paraglaciecola sp. TaxID=1920173 RepID=UPI003EF4CDC7
MLNTQPKTLSFSIFTSSCLLLSACGGGSSSTPQTNTTTPAKTIEPLSVSGLTEGALVGSNESLVITAKSADLSRATLTLNGEDIATISTSPFEFTATNTSQLAQLPIGHHEISLTGIVDNKEQKINMSFRQDGEYLATYAAVNYVHENAPYELNSTNNIGGIAYLAKEGGWIDIAADADIANTEFDSLYTRELSQANIDLAHTVSNGSYLVNLHFAEIWFNGTTRDGRGARLFDVSIEDNLIADDVDIFAEVGFMSAYTIQQEAVEISDGELNISLKGIIENATINAYSIQRLLNAWDDEDSDSILNFDDKCLGTNEGAEIDDNGCALPPPPPVPSETPIKIDGGMFVEKDGLLVVEMESTDHPQGWKFETGRDAAGAGYLNMLAAQAAWKPSNVKEIINVRIKINNPGKYQFQWRNLITKEGVPSTEHNDSYLKIHADKFYGQKGTNIVCPKQLAPENKCTPSGRTLAGEAVLGYFKVYRSGSPIDQWKWSTFTSDSDGHTIFAEFEKAGEYEIEIANRSDYHAIDRFVLFRDGNETNNVTKSKAQDLATPESDREP